MDNYFDILPSEMRTEIFLHLDYYTILRFRDEYPVLSTNAFWNKKIDNDFGKINLNAKLPTGILHFKNQVFRLFEIKIDSYRSYWDLRNDSELLWYILQIAFFDGIYIGYFRSKDNLDLLLRRNNYVFQFCDQISPSFLDGLYRSIMGHFDFNISRQDACNILIRELLNEGAIIKEFD